MTPALRRLALAAALLSQSCVSCIFVNTKPPTTCGSSIAFPTTPQPEEIHAAGQEVSAQLVYELTTSCSDQAGPNVTSVTLEVSDPDGQPISAEASPPVHGSGQYGNSAWSTTVRFTPPKPGAYHVLATFEPGVGLVQKDLWVAVDRRQDAPTITTLPPGNCPHLERTTRGMLVCNLSGSGVRLFRDGAEVATFSYGEAHVAGDSIWVAGTTSGLTRNLDTGSGPPQLNASTPASVGVTVFAVTENDALLWTNDRFRLYHAAGGTLSTDTDVQLAISVQPSAVAFGTNPRALVTADWNRWARVEMPLGHSAPDPTWTEKETAAYQAPNGLWMAIDASTYKFVPADSSHPIVTFIAPAGWQASENTESTLQPGERPLLFKLHTNDYTTDPSGTLPYQWVEKWGDVLVPTVQGNTIQLTAFTAPPDAGFAEVTQGQLRAERGNQQMFWNIDP